MQQDVVNAAQTLTLLVNSQLHNIDTTTTYCNMVNNSQPQLADRCACDIIDVAILSILLKMLGLS